MTRMGSKINTTVHRAVGGKASRVKGGAVSTVPRIWLIVLLFLFALGVIGWGAMAFVRQKAAVSQIPIASQALSSDASGRLRVSPLPPEDYLISGKLTVLSALQANRITANDNMLIGSQSHSLALQGNGVAISTTSSDGISNTLRFAAPSGISKTITVPNASGTLAVSASGALALDVNGNLSCSSCASQGVSTTTITNSSVTNNSITELVTNNYVTNVNNTLKLTAGEGIAITGENGEYTIGSTVDGADRSLSNLSGVAINADLNPAINNAIDLGSSEKSFRNGYFGTSVQAPSLDTAGAGSLSIGTTNATDIQLGADTTIAAGKRLTVNGEALFKSAVNSTSAFQIQDTGGIALLNANTSQGTLSTGVYKPTTIHTATPATTSFYTIEVNPSSTTSTDVDGNNSTDIIVSNLSSSSVSVFKNNGNGTFAAKLDYVTGSSPSGVTHADFNGDGRDDIATSNRSGTASVLLNNGNGTFAAKVDYPAGSSPESITSADFNGDGKNDIAVASGGTSGTTSVLLNNGNGTFAAKVDYPANTFIESISSADVNGDGRVDVVTVSRSSNGASIFLNNGDGTFATKVDYPVGTNAYSVVSANFNGDGHIDLAVANRGSNNTSVLLNNGDGTFATKVDYPVGSSPESITGADFNGDGKADLATANNGSNNTSVLLNNGDGTFAAQLTYAAGSSPVALTSADFNGDSRADLAVPNYSNMSVILLAGFTSTTMTQSQSKFIVNAAPSTIGQLIQGTAGQTADLLQIRDDVNTTLLSVGATGNINAAGTLTVNGAITASSTMSVAGKFTATGSNTLFKNATNSTTAFQVQQANGTSVFGVDTTNGRIGVGVATPANKLSVNTLTTANSTAQVAIGTGVAGNKGLVIQGVASQTANLFEAQSSTGSALASIGATGNALFKNSADSAFAFQVQNSAGIALLNADTSAGILNVGQYVPTVVWSTPPVARSDYATGVGPWGIASADLNGDNKPDIVTANYDSNTVSVLLNNGDGTFAAKVDYVTSTRPMAVEAADLNGDGTSDLAVVNNGASSVSVFLNNGNGTFAAKVDYATGASSNPRHVSIADFNRDNNLDLVTVNSGSGSPGVSVFLNNGDGTFATKVDYSTGATSYSITSGDLNGDGWPDVISADGDANRVSVFMNNGNGTFATRVSYTAGWRVEDVHAADLSGDGKLDLVTANYNDKTISVLLNEGSGTFAPKVDYSTGAIGPLSVTTTDLNTDGRMDIATANPTSSGIVSVFTGKGGGAFASRVEHSTGSVPRSITNADFNGDGQVDLATANTSGNSASALLFGVSTGTAVAQERSRIVVNTDANMVGQLLQGAAGQSADLLQVRDDLSQVLFSVGAKGDVSTSGSLMVGAATISGNLSVAGSALLKNTVNSSSAFDVQQATGTSVLRVSTSSRGVGIGTASSSYLWSKLSVNDLTTIVGNYSAQAAIGTGGNNKGLVIQGIGGQSADLLQAQSSTGAVLASIGATGRLTVISAVVAGDLTVNGHLVTGGVTPTITAGSAACTTPAVSVSGNDTSGTITITTGSSCATIGSLATITFNVPFGSTPRIMLTAGNADSTNLRLYNGSATTTSFTVDTATIPSDATSYKFNYWAVQ